MRQWVAALRRARASRRRDAAAAAAAAGAAAPQIVMLTTFDDSGLDNLRERMDAAGGTLTIDSTPGHGTALFSTPL